MAFMEKEERDGTNRPLAKKRGGGGALSLFRSAIFMIRRRSSGKKAPIHTDLLLDSAAADGGAVWKNLVGGMRPLHLHQIAYPPTPLALLPPPPPMGLEFHDVPLQPPSPLPLPEPSDDSMSRYASAEDLQALDKSEGEADGSEAPNAIDVRAEEFIARFYEQMRLQRVDSFNACNGMIEQSAS